MFHDQVGYWLWEPATGLVRRRLPFRAADCDRIGPVGARRRSARADGRARPDRLWHLLDVISRTCVSDRQLSYRGQFPRRRVVELCDGHDARGPRAPEPFAHRDRNTLVRTKEPAPNRWRGSLPPDAGISAPDVHLPARARGAVRVSRRRRSRVLVLRRLGPPGEIGGEAGEGGLEEFPAGSIGLPSAPSVSAIGPTASVLEMTPSPSRRGSRARRNWSARRNAGARIARDSRRPQNQCSRKWSVKFLRPGCTPQYILRSRRRRVGGADLVRKRLHLRRRMSLRIFLVHPIEHRQADRLGVDQLDVLAAPAKGGDQIVGEGMPIRSDR